ncbi:MAG: hypothetical protein V3W09_04160 [Nitrososphaerales archaeon]
MPTVEDVARSALAKVDSDTSVILAGQWVSQRWIELASQKPRLRILRVQRELNLPASIRAGTVTATRGSSIVTGDATAQAAWSNAIVGRHFRARVTWYRIAQFQTTQLILESEFAEDTATSVGYHITKRYHEFPLEIKHLADPMIHMRLRRPVPLVSIEKLNQFRPSRPTFSSPFWAAEVELSESGLRQFEIYPYTLDDTEILHYVAWKNPPALSFKEEIPPFISPSILEDGVLIDAYRREGMKALKGKEREVGQVLLNEARRQQTKWDGRKREAFIDEKAYDDTEIVVRLFGGLFNQHNRDITTARDHVFFR